MNTNQESLQIANTIIQQMGGINRMAAMTGLKNAVALESGVQFSIGKNCKRITKVKITLNDMDLYDMEFLNIRKIRNTFDFKTEVVAEHNGVYADQLNKLFEESTGLYTKL